MNCAVCGNKIEEGEDAVLLGVDGDFMHKRCQSMWEEYKDRINNMSDAEFYNYLSFSRQITNRKRGATNEKK